ncbi:MAG TPA: type II toxin-antitoxin system Phd/YefM family antitoxin [Candidatus Limnocylindria bacterium]|nr:type II toxin-antitoxin system Phd/YefM family antitoxin [Candidatus Limnocylindria bacterium]
MRTVTAMTLRAKLGEILDAASAGERIVIERDRRPLAILVPFEDANRLVADERERISRNLAALERLAEFRRRTAKAGLHHPAAPDAVGLLRQERSRDDG